MISPLYYIEDLLTEEVIAITEETQTWLLGVVIKSPKAYRKGDNWKATRKKLIEDYFDKKVDFFKKTPPFLL